MIDDTTREPRSALLAFKAENARSYRDEVELSLLAGRLTPKSVVRTIPTAGQPIRVLPAAGIFGANASGKSTLLKAMADMRTFVLESFKPEANTSEGGATVRTKHQSFALLPLSDGPIAEDGIERLIPHFLHPTRYEIDLVVSGVRWQYRLEVNSFRVSAEHAYHYPKRQRALVFRREHRPAENGQIARDDVEFGSSFQASGKSLRQFVRPNVPLLSIAGAAAYEPLAPLFDWFRSNLHLEERPARERSATQTIEWLEQEQARNRVLALLRAADLGIVDAVRDPVDPEIQEIARRAERIWRGGDPDSAFADEDEAPLDDRIRLMHSGPWGVAGLLHSHESMGTLVWVGLIGPVLNALAHGSVLLVDELDASLHPHLVRDLVELFQSPHKNPYAAQLIFNAHDVSLLGDSSDRTLGRDQIWITEKQSDGATTLYPLSDFRPRHDEAIARRYMQGRYGGVPTTNPAEYVRATEPTDT